MKTSKTDGQTYKNAQNLCKNVSEMYLQLNLIRKVNFDAGILRVMMSEVFYGSMIPQLSDSNRRYLTSGGLQQN